MISFAPGYFGWLGNQMFQYAATYALARRRGVECCFPMNRPNLHELFKLSAVAKWLGNRGVRYDEPHFHHDPEFWNLPDGTELHGYFQSEKYFAPYAEDIRREFALYNVGRYNGWVSVHVRRGDYLSFPDHHPPCTVDYYREAMSRFPGARFMVFSDDPGWCLLNLKSLGNVEIVTGNPPIVDMHMMAQCREGHVIANSSFSWWGAWLDPNPDKKVIAPARWFGPAKESWDTSDLIPEGWLRL